MPSIFRCDCLRTLVVAMSLAALAGCGSSGPKRGAIAGSVTLNGRPLEAGRILFTPQAPNRGPAVSATITNGAYALDASEGPVLGVNRVAIEAAPKLGFEIDDEAAFAKRQPGPLPASPIPPKFGPQSTNTVNVAAGDNAYSVAIP